MSTSTPTTTAAQTGPSTAVGLRLRLKPAHRACGFVQGAWWPQSTDLARELPALLRALSLRLGGVDRVIYDENSWTSAPLPIEVSGHSVILDGSGDQSTNTLSVIGDQFGKVSLLVGPPYTNPTRAYTTVMTAAKPDDASTPDELLGIGPHEARDRRMALIAHQRWESEGGALRNGGTGGQVSGSAFDNARRRSGARPWRNPADSPRR